MVENQQDILARLYETLSSLYENIGKMATDDVNELNVKEFHTMLDRLESFGIDVSEFRVPDSVVRPMLIDSHIDSPAVYSDERYVDRPYFLTKLDAILGYLEIATSEKPRRAGFTRPGES